MKIQTFSIVVGNDQCNAQCPYCVSKMTPKDGLDAKQGKINWRNFHIAVRLAKNSMVSTVLLTGKGEPALFPNQISEYMTVLDNYDFPFIELQTNGILFHQKKAQYGQYLKEWYKKGLTTIAISIAHYEDEKNKEIFQPNGKYMNLVKLISYLHGIGFSVRLSCVMFKDGIDSVDRVKNLLAFAKENGVEQLSIRPVAMPGKSENEEVASWVEENELTEKEIFEVRSFLETSGAELMKLIHGAVVYDVGGQNICLTNALTIDPDSEDIRQLIFFPDGHLRYDWQYPGAILL